MKFSFFFLKPIPLLFLLAPLGSATGQNNKTQLLEKKASSIENFSRVDHRQKEALTVRQGDLRLMGGFIEEQAAEKSLKLHKVGWAEYTPLKGVTTAEGTISVWVKPTWKENDKTSHTILSLKWKDGGNGYLALSQGWWEPAGADRLYFILNNQEHLHCSLPYKLTTGFWSNITVTWNRGSTGFCRMYFDGKKVAEKNKSFFPSYLQDGPIFLGSDQGSTDNRNRGFEGYIDDLTIFNSSLNDAEVAELYQNQIKQPDLVKEKKYKWLNDGLKLPLLQERTEDGTLIETRAIFDEDITWATSKFETDRILSRIKMAGFNVYVPCVWHGGGTYFPSTLVNSDARVKRRIDSGEDPLAYLIEKAHSMGIEVHPWFTVVKRDNDLYPQFYEDGTPKGAFNVHKVQFRKFIVDIMIDMVNRYDIDGINLDYIRSMGICTSNFCQKIYEKNINHNFCRDYKFKDIIGVSRDRLEKWQDFAVTQIVEELSKRAKMIKPDVIISVDGHPRPKLEIRPLDGRDEIKWVNNGLIDIIFAMDYRERIDVEKIDLVRKNLNDKSKLVVVFGNYEKNEKLISARPGHLVASFAEFAMKKWPRSGVAFYLYGKLSDEQIISLKKGVFSEPSIPKRPKRINRVHN